MVKRDLEIGAEVLRAVEESEPFALRALEWLLSRQETDEIAAGTSTHKNGRGLNKRDAEFLQSHPPRSLTTEEVRLIVCRYTHTQLVDGVTDGELDLPEKKKRRIVRFSNLQEDSNSEEEEEEEEVTDAASEGDSGGLKLDKYAVRDDTILFPSRQFVERVSRLLRRVKRGPRVARDIQKIIHEEDSWTGFEVELRAVDAALYYLFSPVDYLSTPPSRVRVFWASERLWVNAEVKCVQVRGAEVTVELYFPDEGASGAVSGADAAYAYSTDF